MNIRQGVLRISVVAVAVLAVLLGVWAFGGAALAQGPNPGSGDVPVQPVAPMSTTGDGVPANAAGQVQGVPDVGQDVMPSGTSPALTFSYYRLIGTAFQPRATGSTFDYSSNGCMYQTAGTDWRYQAPLLLPPGATIKFVRLYYIDTVAQDMTVWLTKYQPGVSSADLTSVQSAGAAGYGTSLSAEITHTVDLINYAYVLSWGPGVSGTSNQLCGVRIAYYAPSVFGSFMSLVIKN